VGCVGTHGHSPTGRLLDRHWEPLCFGAPVAVLLAVIGLTAQIRDFRTGRRAARIGVPAVFGAGALAGAVAAGMAYRKRP
jgi:hypothetical protein